MIFLPPVSWTSSDTERGADPVADLFLELGERGSTSGTPTTGFLESVGDADVQRAAVGVGQGAHVGDDGIALAAAHGHAFVEILDDVGAFFLGGADEVEGRLGRSRCGRVRAKSLLSEELAQRFEAELRQQHVGCAVADAQVLLADRVGRRRWESEPWMQCIRRGYSGLVPLKKAAVPRLPLFSRSVTSRACRCGSCV